MYLFLINDEKNIKDNLYTKNIILLPKIPVSAPG